MFQNLPNCKCLDFRTESFISSSSGGWVRTAGWSEASLVPARPHTNPSTQSAGIWQLDGSHFSASRTFFPGILIYFPVPPETHNLTIYLVLWTVDSIYCSSRTGTISPNKSGFYLPTMCCVEIIAQWDHLTILLSTWPVPRCVSIIRRNQNILRRPQVQYRTQCNQISVTTQQHKTKIVGSRQNVTQTQ